MAKIIDNYILLENICQGMFGEIHKGRNLISKEAVAVKTIQLDSFLSDPILRDMIINEIQALKKLEDPRIVRMIKMLKSSNNIYLIYEFLQGRNLKRLLSERHHLSEPEALQIFQQICQGFSRLQKDRIVKRNLSSHSIHVVETSLGSDSSHAATFEVKLKNFFVCKCPPSASAASQLSAANAIGNPAAAAASTAAGNTSSRKFDSFLFLHFHYVAPELLFPSSTSLPAQQASSTKQQISNNFDECDVFSAGVVLYEMLTGALPFERYANSVEDLIEFYANNSLSEVFRADISHLSELVQRILFSTIVANPDHRATWQQIFEEIGLDLNSQTDEQLAQQQQQQQQQPSRQHNNNNMGEYQMNNYPQSGNGNNVSPPRNTIYLKQQSLEMDSNSNNNYNSNGNAKISFKQYQQQQQQHSSSSQQQQQQNGDNSQSEGYSRLQQNQNQQFNPNNNNNLEFQQMNYIQQQQQQQLDKMDDYSGSENSTAAFISSPPHSVLGQTSSGDNPYSEMRNNNNNNRGSQQNNHGQQQQQQQRNPPPVATVNLMASKQMPSKMSVATTATSFGNNQQQQQQQQSVKEPFKQQSIAQQQKLNHQNNYNNSSNQHQRPEGVRIVVEEIKDKRSKIQIILNALDMCMEQDEWIAQGINAATCGYILLAKACVLSEGLTGIFESQRDAKLTKLGLTDVQTQQWLTSTKKQVLRANILRECVDLRNNLLRFEADFGETIDLTVVGMRQDVESGDIQVEEFENYSNSMLFQCAREVGNAAGASAASINAAGKKRKALLLAHYLSDVACIQFFVDKFLGGKKKLDVINLPYFKKLAEASREKLVENIEQKLNLYTLLKNQQQY